MNCCSDCLRINALYSESEKQLDRLFPASIHKIKLNIFQNSSKGLIHVLTLFKCTKTCELYDNIQDKDKRKIIMVNKCFVHRKEVIDVFHDIFYIPTI